MFSFIIIGRCTAPLGRYIISTLYILLSLPLLPIMANSTGYGPSMYSNLVFDGDESKYEMWEVKFI